MPVADAPLAPPFACVGSVIRGSGGASTRGAGGGGKGRSTCRSTERPSSSLSSSSLSSGLPLGAWGGAGGETARRWPIGRHVWEGAGKGDGARIVFWVVPSCRWFVSLVWAVGWPYPSVLSLSVGGEVPLPSHGLAGALCGGVGRAQRVVRRFFGGFWQGSGARIVFWVVPSCRWFVSLVWAAGWPYPSATPLSVKVGKFPLLGSRALCVGGQVARRIDASGARGRCRVLMKGSARRTSRRTAVRWR